MPASIRPLRCAFVGGYAIARNPLRELATWCLGRGHELAGVVAQPPREDGVPNYKKLSPTAKLANDHGLTLYLADSLRKAEKGQGSDIDRKTYDFLKHGNLDLVVVVGSGLIIPKGLLDTEQTRWINMHPSYLPAFRGPAAVARAIANGESETGVTIHQIDAGIDTGPILAQDKCPIKMTDDAEDVTRRLTDLGTNLLVSILNQILEGSLKPKRQPEKDPKGRLGDSINDGERHIRWYDYRAEEAYNRIRGFKGPNEGCHVKYRNTILQIREAALIPPDTRDTGFQRFEYEREAARTKSAGLITAIHPKAGITVLAKDLEPVLLRRVTFGNKALRGKEERPLAQILMELGMSVGDRLT